MSAGRPSWIARGEVVSRRSRPLSAIGWAQAGHGHAGAGGGADARAARPAPPRPPWYSSHICNYPDVPPLELLPTCRTQSHPVDQLDNTRRAGTHSDLTGRTLTTICAAISANRRGWSSRVERPSPGDFFHTPVAQGAPHPVPALNYIERTPLAVGRGAATAPTQTKGDNSTATLHPGSTTRPGLLAATALCLPTVKETPPEQQLLTVQQVTRSLAICRRTLEREIQRQRFPRPVKIGSASRWPASDVQHYVARLAAQRGPATPAP